jgi:hypothetical protein
MASFGYEHRREGSQQPPDGEAAAGERAAVGPLWPLLSLAPEPAGAPGEPGEDRSGYFQSSGWKASDQLWYFDGVEHGRSDPLPTDVTLTAQTTPAGHFDWTVLEGADKVEIGDGREPGRAAGRDDNRVQVRSKSASSGADDVRIAFARRDDAGEVVGGGEGNLGVRTPVAARPAGSTTVAPAAARPVPSEGAGAGEVPTEEEEEQPAPTAEAAPAAPKSLTHKGTAHKKDATFGYETRETYELIDDAGSPIKGFQVNEKWTTAVVNDDATTNWPRGAEGSLTSAGTTFDDQIGAVGAGGTPAPTEPKSPLGSTRIQHWGQDWYVGSLTPGKGTKVQSNTLQKFLDHALHESIKSPP